MLSPLNLSKKNAGNILRAPESIKLKLSGYIEGGVEKQSKDNLSLSCAVYGSPLQISDGNFELLP